MTLLETIPASEVVGQETRASTLLADHPERFSAIGDGIELEGTEVPAAGGRADIVFRFNGEDDAELAVLELQYGAASADHYGRLDRYAFDLGAAVKVLVAEHFDDLMLGVIQQRIDAGEAYFAYRLRGVALNGEKALDLVRLAGPRSDPSSTTKGPRRLN